MNFQKILGTVLGVFVFVILANVHAVIPVSEVSYGKISVQELILDTSHIRPPQPASLANAKITSLIFVGDVLLARNVEVLMERNDYSYPYQGIDFYNFSHKPLVIGNFESSIPLVHKQTEALKINFSTHKKFLTISKVAGFSLFSLANNHSFDSGEEGFQNTIDELLNDGLLPVGHPNFFGKNSVHFIEVEGESMAIIALQAIEKDIDIKETKTAFEYANSNSKFQIVYVHWGIEYDAKHSANQRNLAEKLILAGADVIIGHHPHVVQDIDLIDGVPVFYSLGNYIFDQYFSDAVQQGLMIQLDIGKDSHINLIPVTSIGYLSQPHLMTEGNHNEFLKELAAKSNPLLQSNIEAGVIPLGSKVATSSKVAMINK